MTLAVEPHIADANLMLMPTPNDIGNASDVIAIEVRDDKSLQRLNALRPKLRESRLNRFTIGLTHTTVDEQGALGSAPQDQDAVPKAGLECAYLHGPPDA
jgi:hypothetical protein